MRQSYSDFIISWSPKTTTWENHEIVLTNAIAGAINDRVPGCEYGAWRQLDAPNTITIDIKRGDKWVKLYIEPPYEIFRLVSGAFMYEQCSRIPLLAIKLAADSLK